MIDFEYLRPESLAQAVDFLATFGNETRVLAGGTDLAVDLRQGSVQPNYILDLSRLDELKGIELLNGKLCVGAGVTLSEIYESTLLQQYAPALQKCAASFASKQIRNVATIGGNVAHCSPCADTLPPLLIHETKMVLRSKKGSREVSIDGFASGPYVSTLRPDEIIVRFILEPSMNTNFADFQKIGRRKELATARISMAFMARQDADRSIPFLRFALGACTPTPQRMQIIEDYLVGKAPDARMLMEAGDLLAERMFEITGRRASAIYKEPAVQGLLLRMLYPLL
ncbi:FAD binding domain in molybdopterin dehydrogenase [Syntrophobacter sp. SbD1]|nr:FAD binding domain in molybdopterin dehydrogenase [Syntrophobacter sp. SbD1]